MKEYMSDLDMQILRQGRRQKRFRIMSTIGIAALAVLLYLVFSVNVNAWISLIALLLLFLFTIPYTVTCLILFFLSAHSTGKMQKLLASDIIPRILRELLGECTYERNSHIPEDLVRATAVMPADEVRGVSGNDLITGTYRGLPFAMSDIETYSWSKDSEGNDVTHTYFMGRWMIVKTGFRPDGPVCVLERSADQEVRCENPVITESIEFNERFELSGDPLTVFKLITPPMMEKLLAADRADRGAVTRVKYLPNGTVGISLYTGRDSMEMGTRTFRNEKELREYIASEIRLMFDVVDALELKGEVQ